MEADIKELKELSSEAQSIVKLKTEVVQLQNDFEAMKISLSKTPSYADVVSNLDKETKALKANIDEINVKIKRPIDQQSAGSSGQSGQVEITLTEMQERDARASNALIFGAQEATSDSIEERITHDTRIVKEMLNFVNANTTTDQLKIIRMGRYNPNKRRPIKVTFPSRETANMVLRNKNKVPKECGMYIKFDQTPMQRSYLLNLLAEKQKRTDQGENNLKIKYHAGIPKIVKLRSVEGQNGSTDQAKN